MRFVRFLAAILRARFCAGSNPWRLNFAVTKECHSKCTNCNIWKQGKSPNELSLSEIQTLARNFRNLKWLSLTGGEPSSRSDLAEIVRAFHENSELYLVNLSTNGLNRQAIEKTVQALLEVGVPNVIVGVSLDGPSEINDRLRGIQGDFRLAMKTFTSLVGLEREWNGSSHRGRLKVFISTTLFKENANAMPDFLTELRTFPEFTMARLNLNIAHASPHLYQNSSSSIENFDVRTAVKYLWSQSNHKLNIQKILLQVYQSLIDSYWSGRGIALPCSAVSASVHINEIGTVYPCTVWNKPLGSLRDNGLSLDRVLNQQPAQKTRELALSRKCPGCWTPCESYQTIATYPFQSLLQSVLRK